MKNMNSIKQLATSAAVVAIIAGATGIARAQGPGGGGFAPSPQMMAKFQAWGKWRANHKHVSEVQHTVTGISECEKTPATQLNKAQAKKVMGVLAAWRNKPVMSDGQAAGVIKQLTATLTVPQLKVIAATPEFGQRRGGGGGFGGGRPGGFGGGGFGASGGRPGGGGGARPAGFTMPDPKDYNPLNPNTLPFERSRGRMAQRLDDLNKSLAAAK